MEKAKIPEMVLGVLGGMGPAASAEFMRLMTDLAPAECDQEHPKVFLYSNPQIPDRSSAIIGKGRSPEADLRDGLETLIDWGADLLAVPCNTAHFFIDGFRDELSVPLIHIVEATLELAVLNSPSGAWLLSTEGTLKSGLYQKEAHKIGYRLLLPPEEVSTDIMRSVHLVKAGDLPLSGEMISSVVEELRSIDDLPMVAACTELPLAYSASGLSEDGMISSLMALAKKCIDSLYI